MQARAAKTEIQMSGPVAQPIPTTSYDSRVKTRSSTTYSSENVWLEEPLSIREFVETCVKVLGGHPGRICYLDELNPANIEYATILSAKKSGSRVFDSVLAIYEWQFSPLMYLIDGRNGQTISKLTKLRRCLAMRGDCPYMGVIKNGKMNVYSVALDNKNLVQTQIHYDSIKGQEVALFAYLANIRPHASNQSHYIASIITNLLTQSVERLQKSGDFPHETDTVAAVETAFLARILIDQNLFPVGFNKGTSPKQHSNQLDQTFKWLEENCVGNQLSSFQPGYSNLTTKSNRELKNIMSKSAEGIENIKWNKTWQCFDFALVPTTIISQVLGQFFNEFYQSRLNEIENQITPSPIADFMSLTAIESTRSTKKFNQLKILDPAVGTGVILIAIFRQLVLEHWLTTKSPPTIGSLLLMIQKQLTGFDINESAIRFAWLSLNLMTLELAEIPDFTQIVGNNKIRDKVLHNVSNAGDDKEHEYGSLNEKIGQKYRGKFDIIISDPPWHSNARSKDWKILKSQIQEYAKHRYFRDTKKILPFQSSDLAFIWRAMEWAKPEGQIAITANAKLLVGQENGINEAREILFSALDLKYIINGTEIGGTSVWPNNPESFCLIQGINRAAPHNLGIKLFTPQFETGLNASGLFRITHQSPNILSPAFYLEHPFTIKNISSGSEENHGIYSRMLHRNSTLSIESQWQKISKVTGTIPSELSGNGYTNGYCENNKGNYSQVLLDVGLSSTPDLIEKNVVGPLIGMKDIEPLDVQKINFLPKTGIFKAPILIVNQSLSKNDNRIQATISNNDLLYNSSYIGFSTHGYPNGISLLKYLCIILRSRVAIWQLLVSGENFGVSNVKITKDDLDKILIPDFNSIKESKLVEVNKLFKDICQGQKTDIELDEWVTELYRISDFNYQTICDTIEFQLPFANNRKKSQLIPKQSLISKFKVMLESQLGLHLQTKSMDINLTSVDELSVYPYICFYVNDSNKNTGSTAKMEKFKASYLQTISSTSESTVFLEMPDGFLFGVLAQQRNFNQQSASSLADKIVSLFSSKFKASLNG